MKFVLAVLAVAILAMPVHAEDLNMQGWLDTTDTGCRGYAYGDPDMDTLTKQRRKCLHDGMGHGYSPWIEGHTYEPLSYRLYLKKDKFYTGPGVCEVHLQWKVPTADTSVSRKRGFGGSAESYPSDLNPFYDFVMQSTPTCNIETQQCQYWGQWKDCVCLDKDELVPTVGERLFTWNTEYSKAAWHPDMVQQPHDDVLITGGIGGINLTDKPFNTLNLDIVSSDGTDIFQEEDTTVIETIYANLQFATSIAGLEARCDDGANNHQGACMIGYEDHPFPDTPEGLQAFRDATYSDYHSFHIGYTLPLLSAYAVECTTGAPIDTGTFYDGLSPYNFVPSKNSSSGYRPYALNTIWHSDNCVHVWNPEQRDWDGDGLGDACDADYNNDSVVYSTGHEDGYGTKITTLAGGPDFAEFTTCFGCSYDEACWTGVNECGEKDHNADGTIGGPDYGTFLKAFRDPSFGTGFAWGYRLPVQFECTGRQPVGTDAGGIVTQAPEGAVVVPDQYIVRVNSQSNVAAEKSHAQSKRGNIRSTFRGKAATGFVANLPNKGVAKGMANRPNVVSVRQDWKFQLDAASGQWGQDRIDQLNLPLDNVYTVTDGSDGSGVHVFIFDSGIDPNHSEFTGLGDYYNGFTQNENNADIEDANGHGTHVAGIIGGNTYGVAPGATLHAVKTCNELGWCYQSALLDGIDWAMQTIEDNSWVDVVSNSSFGGVAWLEGQISSEDWHGDEYCAWIEAGHTAVVSAGNKYGRDACRYSPARIDQVITVASSQIDDTRSSFTNLGSCIDMYAPGTNILSAWKYGATQTISGTSMASPHVAGAAAIWLERNPGATPAQVIAGLLVDSSDSKISDNTTAKFSGTVTPNKLLCVEDGGC